MQRLRRNNTSTAMQLLEKSKHEFERECVRHYDNRKRGDRTIEVQKLLSKYKELRKNFKKNGKQCGLEMSQYSRLLDITYTPSGIPLKERLVLFQELHDDVQESLEKSKSKKGQNILTALKILNCAADKSEGVEKSIAIAKKNPSCDPIILGALLYVRYLSMGSIATKEWMEQVVKDAWFYHNGPVYFKWTPRICNTIVFYLSKDRNFTEALEFIKTMPKLNIKASASTFNFVLTSLTRNGRSEEAKKVFKEMELQKISHDRLSFESMIESVLIPYARESLSNKSGNSNIDGVKPSLMVKEAKYFLNGMKKKVIKPSAWTFNSFMTFYMVKEDYLKVEKYFNAMKEEGVVPNLKSYSIMLTTFFKSRNVLKAQEILDQLDQQNLVFDKVLYTICLDGFQKYGMYDKALSYYVKMLNRGYRPEIEDYHILFDLYCRKGDIGTASRFWSEFIEAGHTPNEITFCLFIKAYGICGDLENAKLAFGIMDRFGIKKSVISYNTLISAHLKQGKISDALGIVDEMIEIGIKPDIRTSYMVLNGYAKIGDEASLLKAFGRHVESGFQADAFAINTIVAFYTKKNETDKALKIAQFLFDSSKDNPRLNIEPAYTHSIVMQPMVSNHMYPQMEKYYALLKEIKLFNIVCFDIYLRSLYSRGNYDLIAKEFWSNAVTNFTPDHRLYDTFISIMLKGGRKIECRYAIKHMLKNGLRPTRRIKKLMDQVGQLEYFNDLDQRTIEPLD